jgi:hypothetical protein
VFISLGSYYPGPGKKLSFIEMNSLLDNGILYVGVVLFAIDSCGLYEPGPGMSGIKELLGLPLITTAGEFLPNKSTRS